MTGSVARVTATAEAGSVNVHTMKLALRRIAAIVAAKDGHVCDITVGDLT